MGPKDGTPITYYWNPINNVAGLLPWIIVLLAFVLFRENRHLQAIWILLPTAIILALWAGFVKLTGMSSGTSALFMSMADVLLIGLALNWLLGQRIGNRNRFATWLLSLLVYIPVWGVILLNLGLRTEAVQISIFIGLTIGILHMSFALAGFSCRKKIGPVRFSLWLAIWIFITTAGFFTGIAAIQAALTSYLTFAEILSQLLMVVLVYSGILIVAMLPFEILLFTNRFWHKRFDMVFQLKSKAVAVESALPTGSPESQHPVEQ